MTFLLTTLHFKSRVVLGCIEHGHIDYILITYTRKDTHICILTISLHNY